MKRTILFTTTLATGISLFAFVATAQQSDDSQSAPEQVSAQQHMSLSKIAGTLEEKGYVVREIEYEDGRYEVEMIDSAGMRVEAYLDPVTGAVLAYDDNDDRYERDDD